MQDPSRDRYLHFLWAKIRRKGDLGERSAQKEAAVFWQPFEMIDLDRKVVKLSNGLGDEWAGARRRNMEKWKNILQLFADDGAGSEGNGEGSGADGTDGADGAEGQEHDLSFDDFLKQGSNQAEFDRRIQKAIQTAVTNAQKKWKALTDDKVSEAEKLAQMTAEQKATYRADKAEKELADLKRQMALGDMARTARKILSDERISLPDEIIMSLVTDDADKTKESVESFAKAFKEAVQEGVKEALRGNPPKASKQMKPITREEILNLKNADERRRLIAENPHLFMQQK